MRDSASWYIGCSRITELPSGERDEDVVEGGMVRRERRELEPALLHQREERGQRAMQLRHGQRESDAAGARPHGGHATEAPHAVLFFVQAEDGIRDGRVTGVQTCALPI